MPKTKMLPLEPLEEYARRVSGLKEANDRSEITSSFNDVVFAQMVGVTVRSIARWRAAGELTWISADAAATNLGQHPVRIWGDAWIDLDMDVIEDGAHSSEIEKALVQIGEVMALRSTMKV